MESELLNIKRIQNQFSLETKCNCLVGPVVRTIIEGDIKIQDQVDGLRLYV